MQHMAGNADKTWADLILRKSGKHKIGNQTAIASPFLDLKLLAGYYAVPLFVSYRPGYCSIVNFFEFGEGGNLVPGSWSS